MMDSALVVCIEFLGWIRGIVQPPENVTGDVVIAYHVKQTSHEKDITANHTILILHFRT